MLYYDVFIHIFVRCAFDCDVFYVTEAERTALAAITFKGSFTLSENEGESEIFLLSLCLLNVNIKLDFL